MADQGCEFNFFQGIHVRIKNWYLHLYKTYNQIRQVGTSTGFSSNETNHAGAGDVITSRSRDKLKTYLHYQSAYGHQTWQDVTYLNELLPIKSRDPLITWSCKITRHTKIIIAPLQQCLWPPNLAGWQLTLTGSCL